MARNAACKPHSEARRAAAFHSPMFVKTAFFALKFSDLNPRPGTRQKSLFY